MHASSSDRSARSPAKILIVDDHPIVSHGLRQLIDEEHDLEVCGTAANSAEALEHVRGDSPDLVVLDLSLGEESGLELLKQLRASYPELKVLVLSMHEESFYADRALRAGSMGYIMKQEPAEQMLGAIRQVLDGRVYVSPAVAETMLTRLVGRKSLRSVSPVELLTDRELQVLQLIGGGMGTREISEKLNLSIKTVESYREQIKAKLHLKTASQLVRYAVQWTLQGD